MAVNLQPVESTSLSIVLVSDDINLHPYDTAEVVEEDDLLNMISEVGYEFATDRERLEVVRLFCTTYFFSVRRWK